MNLIYDPSDPEKLLQLKRKEAEALIEVLRSFNQAHLPLRYLFMIVQNTLMAQLRVKRMLFVYQDGDNFENQCQKGIDPLDSEAAKELPRAFGAMEVKAEDHPELAKRCVEYVVPLMYKNEIGGWFLVADFAESEAEKENDLLFIETLGSILCTAIENRSLVKELVEQESLKRELGVAEKIQKQLLVSDFSSVRGAKIYAKNVSHQKIGGDYYDVVARGNKGFFLCIADVAGKGIGAALLMANLQANLRALILSENTLKDIIYKLHDLLLGVTRGDKFVTLFLAYVDTVKKEIEYINAGHTHPWIIREGEAEELDKGTIPLGIVNLPQVELGKVPYQDKDLMFLYTDGLIEQHNQKGEMLDEAIVLTELCKLDNQSPRQIVKHIADFHKSFADGAPVDDDLTLMAVRFQNL